MNAATILALADLFLTGLEKLGPRIAELRQKGEITLEQEKALEVKIAAIRSGGAFTADHWKAE